MENQTITGRISDLSRRLNSLRRDERGAAALFFAVGLLVLAPVTVGLVDVYMVTTQRGQLQDALDTATLYAARSTATTTDAIQSVGDKALRANMTLPAGQTFTKTSFELKDNTVVGKASISAPNLVPVLWKQQDVSATSEVLRNSNNVEVAMVLDTTGSMQDEIGNLKTAAKDLVDLVVKDEAQQKVFYTKVAIVPYSVGVNISGYETVARGTTKGPTNISGATKASPVVVTSNNHGLYEGERVRISGVGGMTNLNGNTYVARNVTQNTFQLYTYANSKFTAVSSSQTYTGGGTAQCRGEGCPDHIFTNANGADITTLNKTFPYLPTTCATERVGDHAYDDAGPSVAKVGWHYLNPTNGTVSCPSRPIMPLSIDRTKLKAQIDSLSASGATAGQIGLAWGWYMISPEWGGLWPDAASKPAPYGAANTLKVVILMTDGAFNTPYCRGVVAANAGSGATAAASRINCNAVNGDPFEQAKQLCKNMKDKKVIVYTVGFNVGSEPGVADLMKNCATGPEYAYLPNNGTDLKVAFRTIAQDINSLRLSK